MKEKIYIGVIAVLLIVIIIMGIQIGKGTEKAIPKEGKTVSKTEGEKNDPNDEETFTSISFNENISKDGTVEGVEGLNWSHARIDEDEGLIRVDITLENRTENNIEAKKLKISLYNKEGKEIAVKEVETAEIEANKHEFINAEIEKEIGSAYEVIYDVKISSI